MNLPLFIARKYFLSKKKKNFINLISIISMSGVAVGTMALVIVLSVFNGLEDLIKELNKNFDPELKVEAVKGKSFELSSEFLNGIKSIEGVEIVTQIVEDNAYAKYKNDEMVVKMKGVEKNFIDHHRIDRNIVQGRLVLEEDGVNYAIIARGVQTALSINRLSNMYTLQFYYPKRGRMSGISMANLNHKVILPAGVYAIEKQYDMNYVFVPLDFAVELLDYGNRRTSLEIKVNSSYGIPEVKERLISFVGDDFRVLTSEEIHADFFKVLKIEKLFVFIIFSFILAIASFNIFFSLTMLAIDKKKDIAILSSIGADKRLIKSIFLTEGAIISFLGAFLGLFLGLVICLIQQNFGIVSMGMQTAVIDAYPVKIQFPDFLYTGLSIITITLLASYRPAIIASNTAIPEYL
ncbi:MAG: ABC transporter permease [Cyclobacteriaceae bacterium]|nr:ABC transporter permease [Cyclobacteriaceae bacterium]MCK5470526.1 ABC transporter permease [Cyclobacteriaceae bacterium]